MAVPELNQGQNAQREVVLWDLAGQPGYRIVHQLHLGRGAVALILFESRNETAPLAGIGYWARALQHAQASGELLPTFLIAARTDRGVVGVSDERIAQVIAEFAFRGHLPTSAKEGWGVAELLAAILGAIDWTRMPVVTSSALFAAAKELPSGPESGGNAPHPAGLAARPGARSRVGRACSRCWWRARAAGGSMGGLGCLPREGRVWPCRAVRAAGAAGRPVRR
jgi:hypothetical protein